MEMESSPRYCLKSARIFWASLALLGRWLPLMSQAGLLSEDLLAEPEPILVPLAG